MAARRPRRSIVGAIRSFLPITAAIVAPLHRPTPRCDAMRVLVIGGSGRVGGSTVRWLERLTKPTKTRITTDDDDVVSISIGGRKWESYDAALRSGVIPRDDANFDFVNIDVDGDANALAESLRRWKGDDDGTTRTRTTNTEVCIVVNTAGPFQGRRSPTLLSCCIDMSIHYVDVCDEWELAEASRTKLHRGAIEAGSTCVICCGIWPGVSALMAAEGVSQLVSRLDDDDGDGDDGDVVVESVDYSFFTAGTGNAGPTIVSATFLLLATEVMTFLQGKRTYIEPWTSRKDVDFGGNVGTRPVWLLDNPDVPTTAMYLHHDRRNKGKAGNDDDKPRGDAVAVRNCSSRFGTSPLFWNYLFGAMKALPRSLLYDRDAMQGFSLFSEPIIRFVDMLVGSTNAMRVDITASRREAVDGDGDDGKGRKREFRRESVTLRMVHPDLESCVGLATASFALEVADSVVTRGGARGEFREKMGKESTIEPGVWFPVELGERARTNILRSVRQDASVYELGEDFA
jgi:hypothetical protein